MALRELSVSTTATRWSAFIGVGTANNQNTPNNNTANHLSNTWHSSPLTPVSPDEEIIRLRGRRRAVQQQPVSNTIEEVQLTPKKSPRKSVVSGKTPQKLTPPKTPSTPLRTSPRKRLNLQNIQLDPTTLVSYTGHPTSPRKRGSPNSKRLRLSVIRTPGNLEGALSSLSHSQLVELVKGLSLKHPQLDVEELLPLPDLSPMEEKLNSLQRNIYRSIPSTRWESNRDAFCYRRITSHLESFKKECMDQGRKLITHCQWTTALDYTVLAWRYVKSLPDWDNPSHNRIKLQCFKYLAGISLTCVKKGQWTEEELDEILQRLNILQEDSKTLGACIKLIEEKLNL